MRQTTIVDFILFLVAFNVCEFEKRSGAISQPSETEQKELTTIGRLVPNTFDTPRAYTYFMGSFDPFWAIALRIPFPKLKNAFIDLMEKFLFYILCINADTSGKKSIFKRNNECKYAKIKFVSWHSNECALTGMTERIDSFFRRPPTLPPVYIIL